MATVIGQAMKGLFVSVFIYICNLWKDGAAASASCQTSASLKRTITSALINPQTLCVERVKSATQAGRGGEWRVKLIRDYSPEGVNGSWLSECFVFLLWPLITSKAALWKSNYGQIVYLTLTVQHLYDSSVLLSKKKKNKTKKAELSRLKKMCLYLPFLLKNSKCLL